MKSQLCSGVGTKSVDPAKFSFDQKENKAIFQASIWDSATAFNGRQQWYPLEVILSAWLDMVEKGKAQAVPKTVSLRNAKYDPWIFRPYSENQLEDTIRLFNQLVEAIELRLPQSSSAAASREREDVNGREPILRDDDEFFHQLNIPNGFARSLLTHAHRPNFRFIAPGIEIPSQESFTQQPFRHIRADGDDDNDDDPGNEEGEEPTQIKIYPVLLFHSSTTQDLVNPSDPPFYWPYNQVSTIPAGLYITATDREFSIEFEDSVKLVLPFGIGANGFARTADGARFGENTEDEDNVEPKDTFCDLYQLGFVPFGEQHDVRLAQVLEVWLRQVESGNWTVGPEGIEGGMEKWKEADTEEHWEEYVVPVSW